MGLPLPQAFMAGLPSYSSSNAPGQEPEKCPVCIQPLEGPDSTVTPCGHAFCRDCLTEWVNNPPVPYAITSSCPMCRKELCRTVDFTEEDDDDPEFRHTEHFTEEDDDDLELPFANDRGVDYDLEWMDNYMEAESLLLQAMLRYHRALPMTTSEGETDTYWANVYANLLGDEDDEDEESLEDKWLMVRFYLDRIFPVSTDHRPLLRTSTLTGDSLSRILLTILGYRGLQLESELDDIWLATGEIPRHLIRDNMDRREDWEDAQYRVHQHLRHLVVS